MTESALQSDDPMAPDLAIVDVLTVLQALSDPVRLGIVRQLAACDADAGGLMCGQIDWPVSKSTGSHHLKVLHESGLLDRSKRGVWVYYRVTPGALADLGALIGGVAG